ncbi:MAG TPA: TPM domain-containing protein [Acidimicrobiales bacterium]|nr:TPM domain-containing protein [Acidimicrobiales bacterium]
MTRRRWGSASAVFVVALGLLAGAGPAAAAEVPAFTAPVVDAAGVVPDEVERQVSAGLADYQARSGNQVAVAVVATTGDQSIEDYSIDLARRWGVGREGDDNGVVLVIAVEDRRLRIEVGRGLEGTLTDLQSGRIIRERLIPLLREGNLGEAVAQGAAAIRAELGDAEVGELPPPPAQEEPAGASFPWPLLLIPAFGLLSLGRRRRRYGGFGGGGASGSW